MHVHIERTKSSKSWRDMPEKHCGLTQEQSILAGEWWKIVCRINCQHAKTTSPSWMTWFGPMSALGSGDGKAMFMVKPFWKKLDLTWRRCNVTSKMRCRCGFAANPLRNRSFFQVPNLQIMQKKHRWNCRTQWNWPWKFTCIKQKTL